MGERYVGLSGAFVDDLSRAWTPEFVGASDVTSNRFDSTPAIFDDASFPGVRAHETVHGFSTDMFD